MEQTCPRCGYQRTHCQCGLGTQKFCNACSNPIQYCRCGRGRNTDGSHKEYHQWDGWSSTAEEEFSTTSRIFRRNPDEAHLMEEIIPIPNEELLTYVQRAYSSRRRQVEYLMHRHIYGTKRTWPCHTTTRTCPVCAMCQIANVSDSLIKALIEYGGYESCRIQIKPPPNGDFNRQEPEITIVPPVKSVEQLYPDSDRPE